MKTNKMLFTWMCGFILLPLLSACSDEENMAEPPKTTPQTVVEVVETLEENVPQASDFLQVLKKTDLTNIKSKELTVFAVQNKVKARTDMAGLDTVTIKRHMVEGSYKKEQLTDGQELTCINGDKLSVSKAGDEIAINGVLIVGEAIPVGNSYIYVVPQVIPEREVAEQLHETTIKVYHLITTDVRGPKEPLPDVRVRAFNSLNDSLGFFMTDPSGEVVIKHASDTLLFELVKDEFKSYTDSNGDGIITNDEQRKDKFRWVYKPSVNNVTIHCLMRKSKSETTAPTDINKLSREWKTAVGNFYACSRETNEKLAFGYNRFNYNRVDTVANRLWNDGYQTVNKALDFIAQIESRQNNSAEWEKLKTTIQTELGIIYSNLAGYYDQIVFKSHKNDAGTNDRKALLEYLQNVEITASDSLKWSVCALQARIHLQDKAYENAYRVCEKIIASGRFQLRKDALSSYSNPGVIHSGIKDSLSFSKGTYFHPIRYVEILLIAAEAANQIGKRQEAVRYINEICMSKGEVAMATEGSTKEELNQYIERQFEKELNHEGLEYTTWRRWGTSDKKMSGVSGYQSHHQLLPIPASALNTYPVLKQNPGY